MSLLSPQRDNKLKLPPTPVIQTKITRSPPSTTSRTINITNTNKVTPASSFLRQSPLPNNPENKKTIVDKQQPKTKVQNTSIQELENKLGQLDSMLATIKQPTSATNSYNNSKVQQSPINKKTKVQTKKSSLQAKKKSQTTIQSPTGNLLYKKQPVKKNGCEIVKAFETSKMLVSPSDMLINPRLTADLHDKSKISKFNNNSSNPIDTSGNERKSFKIATGNNILNINARNDNQKNLKSNQHSEKNVHSPSNTQNSNKMRVTMSNKLLPKGIAGLQKKGPIPIGSLLHTPTQSPSNSTSSANSNSINNINTHLNHLKSQNKSENCKTQPIQVSKNTTHSYSTFSGQNMQLSMIKQKKKVYEANSNSIYNTQNNINLILSPNVNTTSSTIFTSSNMKLGTSSSLSSSRNNVNMINHIQKKQYSKQGNTNTNINTNLNISNNHITPINYIPNSILQQTQIKISDFQIIKPLGSGKFSQVFLAVHKKSGILVAIKQISKDKVKKFNMVRQVTDQIRLHSSLNHPNIIKFYALLQDKQNIFLILQYVQGGSLFQQLAQKSKLSYRQTVIYLKDVISAIQYLHQKSIAHRDIKPENILIGMNCVAKICDLGWSAIILTYRKTYCGTFDYVPPEILQKKDYDLSVDIWCLGVLTYELLTGKVPYEGDKHTVVMSKINNVQIAYPQQSQQFPLQAKTYIQWLLQHNPQQRPKSKQLLEHKFFQVAKQQQQGVVGGSNINSGIHNTNTNNVNNIGGNININVNYNVNFNINGNTQHLSKM